MANKTTKGKEINFEEALTELEEITRKLESGKETLEESMALYQRGIELKSVCENKLGDAEGQWKILRKKTNSEEYTEENLSMPDHSDKNN
ncbi:MAG: exodeoxyribonuclease VII small subunit [Leptospiraceae bacterium]|nr:exodeoxyribonuclease VII small subunit [Leptospiraceae bacterium]